MHSVLIADATAGAREGDGVNPVLNAEEQAAMDALLGIMRTITIDWEMKANGGELTAAVHVLQGYIVQHMLHRLAPDAWNSWR